MKKAIKGAFSLLSGGVILLLIGLLLTSFRGFVAQSLQPSNVPAPGLPVTHLGFVSQARQDSVPQRFDLLAHPLANENGLNVPSTTGNTHSLMNQATSGDCQVSDIHASPNRTKIILQYDCHANAFSQLLEFRGRAARTITVLERGYFLDWSPDGRHFLFRQVDNDGRIYNLGEG